MMHINTTTRITMLNLIIKLYNFNSIMSAIQSILQQEQKMENFQGFYKVLTTKGLQYS